jgi:hypothetical protein
MGTPGVPDACRDPVWLLEYPSRMSLYPVLVADALGWIGAIGGAVAAACGVPVLWCAWKQSKFTDRLETRETEDAQWAAEFISVAEAILRIFPRWLPGQTNAYGAAFQNPNFRTKIEHNLIEVHPNSSATRRLIEPDMLRQPAVRDTIIEAKKQIEHFIDEHPEFRDQLGF